MDRLPWLICYIVSLLDEEMTGILCLKHQIKCKIMTLALSQSKLQHKSSSCSLMVFMLLEWNKKKLKLKTILLKRLSNYNLIYHYFFMFCFGWLLCFTGNIAKKITIMGAINFDHVNFHVILQKHSLQFWKESWWPDKLS